MQKNVGSADKTIRIVAGIVLIAMVFVGPQTAWGWIGIIPLATAFMSWCPLYSLVGMRTCAAPAAESSPEPAAAEPVQPASQPDSASQESVADAGDSDEQDRSH